MSYSQVFTAAQVIGIAAVMLTLEVGDKAQILISCSIFIPAILIEEEESLKWWNCG